jgi:P-type Mg2+ transporter
MNFKVYTTESTDWVLEKLQTSSKGLSLTEVQRRLAVHGKNTLSETEHFIYRVLKRKLSSFLFWVFLLAVGITFFFDNYLEASLIVLFLFVNAALEVYQEFHSEKAAQLLKRYLVPRATVIRESHAADIASHFLVPGDIVELRAGDRIPADVRFLETEGVLVDESLITGETVAVPKTPTLLSVVPASLFEATNTGFAGTSITTGKALAVVVATGPHTALGDIAHITALTEKETAFEKDVRNFSAFLVKFLLVGLLIIFLLYFIIHGTAVSVPTLLVFLLVLSITVVPEALPAIITVALSRGSLVLAKKQVVVKRLSAIEDLGSIEVLCTDKTGTLTENILQVAQTFSAPKDVLIPLALLATRNKLTNPSILTDAFDKALWQAATSGDQENAMKKRRGKEVPFDPESRLNVVQVFDNNQARLIARGAPEAILQRVEGVDSFTRKAIGEWIQEAGTRGERVLALATKSVAGDSRIMSVESGLHFEGLISFFDPIKVTAKETIQNAKKLGIEVKIFSGDSKEVVGSVAYAVGLIKNTRDVLTGAEFESMTLPRQIQAIEEHCAFARFSPAQKFAALGLLQKNHTVGFLGEGINDAPALKLAHVALVVQSASDIAREASDILLLDKDLRVIIDGVKEGRRVFANILKYLKITLAANFGNFYSVTIATLTLPFLPLLPLQILLLNLLSDFPMLSIATDNVEKEKLERPNANNFQGLVAAAILFGGISTLFDLTVFRLYASAGPAELQTAWFLFSLVTELLLIYSLRSRGWFFNAKPPSIWLGVFTVLVIFFTAAILFSPAGAFLGFALPSGKMLGTLLLLAALYFTVTEAAKRGYYFHRLHSQA